MSTDSVRSSKCRPAWSGSNPGQVATDPSTDSVDRWHNRSIAGLVDIHCHVLPGIDDGPPELSASLEMARAASDSGTATLAATPHLRGDFPNVHVREIAGRCESLQGELAEARIDISIICGAEVGLTWALEASDEDLKLASYGQRGTDLLIETPSIQAVGLDRLLYALRVKGYRITLAHPERSSEFQRDHAPLADLVDQGVLLQVNAESVLGSPRKSQTAKLARRLCRDGLAHAIASDGHRAAVHRPVTLLADARDATAGLLGLERAEWMTVAVPEAIISGRVLPDPPAIAQRGSLSTRWSEWFGT